MKKIILTMLMSVAALSLVGCAPLTFQEPSSLIMPPASTHEEYLERSLINTYLSDDERLEVPDNMDSAAAYIDLDTNGDGEEEKLVFWSGTNRREVGALLLAKNSENEWLVSDQIRQYGNAINYFKLVDFNSDGTKEMCFGVDIGGYNVLYIYSIEGNKLEEIERVNYSLVDIVDLNGKGTYGVLVALNDGGAQTPTSKLYLYKLIDKLECVYEKSYDGACVVLEYGKVAKNQTGVYYVRTSDYSKLNAELLLKKVSGGFEEQMTSSFTYLNTASGFSNIIKDVDGDGVLDVRTLVAPVEDTKRNVAEFLQVWKSWDGDVGLDNVYGLIENATDGYDLVLPKDWLGTVRYQYVTEKNCNQIRIYEGQSDEPVVIYSSALNDEKNQTKVPAGSIDLGSSPSRHYIYYATVNAKTVVGKSLDEKAIKATFQIEGGEVNE